MDLPHTPNPNDDFGERLAEMADRYRQAPTRRAPRYRVDLALQALFRQMMSGLLEYLISLLAQSAAGTLPPPSPAVACPTAATPQAIPARPASQRRAVARGDSAAVGAQRDPVPMSRVAPRRAAYVRTWMPARTSGPFAVRGPCDDVIVTGRSS